MFSIDAITPRTWHLARPFEGWTIEPVLKETRQRAPLAEKRTIQKPVGNVDAELALQTLGVDKMESKRQVQIALGISPDATTQELIVMCLKGK